MPKFVIGIEHRFNHAICIEAKDEKEAKSLADKQAWLMSDQAIIDQNPGVSYSIQWISSQTKAKQQEGELQCLKTD